MTYCDIEPKVKFCDCWRSSGVEQLPCKQWVGGSNPPLPTTFAGEERRVERERGNSSAVERQPSKLGVAGSNPVSRSSPTVRGTTGWVETSAHVAQLAEHALGKGEVSGSSPDMGSITLTDRQTD